MKSLSVARLNQFLSIQKFGKQIRELLDNGFQAKEVHTLS